MGNGHFRRFVPIARAVARRVIRRIPVGFVFNRATVDRFHDIYYWGYGSDRIPHQNTFWLGIPASKCPLDLWIYQEIIFDLKPDVIVECGTAHGGSALFMASMFDIIGKGKVISIDIMDSVGKPAHKRIEYLVGSSTSPNTAAEVTELLTGKEIVMVILDSDHSKEHVLNELRIYSRFVTPGSYLIVEDTNVNGHPVHPGHGPGPTEAVQQFLKENDGFAIDRSKEKFYLTFNPGGYLRKKQTVGE
jgi:cephalosporin hydroxylase